jgi:hypothetical protein
VAAGLVCADRSDFAFIAIRDATQLEDKRRNAMSKTTTKYRANILQNAGIWSWVVLDIKGRRVASGVTRSSAEANLAAEKTIWRLKQRDVTRRK